MAIPRRAFPMKRLVVFAVLAASVALVAGWLLMRDDRSRMRVVGIVLFTTNNVETMNGFKEGLAALGWVEGVSIRYVYPGVAEDADTLARNVREILAAKPDLLFASPTPAAVAAQKATGPSGVPVVFAPVNSPVSAGVVLNLARPEANLTGVGLAPSEGRRLQSLLSMKPDTRTVFVPYNPSDLSARSSLDLLMQSSRELGVEIVSVPMEAHATQEKMERMVPEGADAVFLPRDAMAMSRYKVFNALAVRRRIPMSTPRLDQVENGVLTGYGFVGREIGRQAAAMAHLLLKGTPVSSIPVETAQDFLFLNLGTARDIGLTVPDSILRQAHYIVRPDAKQP